MKKQLSNNKYSTKFYKDTFAFAPGIDIAEITKMPAYNSAGRQEYKRHLPPLKDLTKIDLQKLATIVMPIDKFFNPSNIQLKDGICTIEGWSKFRFKDLFDLLRLLRKENRILATNDQLKEIKVKYYESN